MINSINLGKPTPANIAAAFKQLNSSLAQINAKFLSTSIPPIVRVGTFDGVWIDEETDNNIKRFTTYIRWTKDGEDDVFTLLFKQLASFADGAPSAYSFTSSPKPTNT